MKLTIIKGAQVYAPRPLGKCDLVFTEDKILNIGHIDTKSLSGLPLEIIDGSDKFVMPGIVDPLVHINGGGGEGGYHTRTPQMPVSDAIYGGVTTLISGLGTDAVTRSLEDMLARIRTFSHYGLSAYAYTGSYHLPPVTLTGDLTRDIVLINEVLGIGEVAIADHRGSQPDAQALATIAANAKVGGMLSGKSGTVFVHVGEGKSQLSLLEEICEKFDVIPKQFYPTHINRNESLLNAGIKWAKSGGYIDFTASSNNEFLDDKEIPAAKAVMHALHRGVPIDNISVSSDGNASLPVFNNVGEVVGMEIGSVGSVYQCFKELVEKYDLKIEKAIQVISSSAASILKLDKGQISIGRDADILVVSAQSKDIEHVFARGRHLLCDGKINIDIQFE